MWKIWQRGSLRLRIDFYVPPIRNRIRNLPNAEPPCCIFATSPLSPPHPWMGRWPHTVRLQHPVWSCHQSRPSLGQSHCQLRELPQQPTTICHGSQGLAFFCLSFTLLANLCVSLFVYVCLCVCFSLWLRVFVCVAHKPVRVMLMSLRDQRVSWNDICCSEVSHAASPWSLWFSPGKCETRMFNVFLAHKTVASFAIAAPAGKNRFG